MGQMGLIYGKSELDISSAVAAVKNAAAKPQAVYSLSGRLYKSESGWILLHVPNALVHGCFDALDEPGAELPPGKPSFNAHISVMRPDELEQIGGADKITERGHSFKYQLGRIKTVSPAGWKEMSKVWFIEVKSPELEKLRKSYGLSARPKDNEFAFHITVAVRRKNVLRDSPVSKAASRVFAWPWLKASYSPEPEEDWKSDLPIGDARAFVEYMICHNRSDCDSGELGGVPDKEVRRLKNEWKKLSPKDKLRYHRQAKTAAIRGIPNKMDQGDLAKLRAGQLLDFIIQRHEAVRAGPHYDVRFGDPNTGLFSWATRKELPGPGGRIAGFRQPLHSHSYGAFQGIIPHGYGAGTVRTHRRGQIMVTKVAPDKILFTTADERYPERFVLFKPARGRNERHWLMVNVTPREPIPYEKVPFQKIPAEEVEQHLANLQTGSSVQAKIDGAASLVALLKDGVEVVSYRKSKETGRPIVHTERMFHGRPQTEIPPELVGTILKGELYAKRETPGTSDMQPLREQSQIETGDGEEVAQKALHETADQMASASDLRGVDAGTGNVLPPQELGGLLNAALGKSIEEQRRRGVRLRTMLHNIQRLGKEDIPEDMPYGERRALIAKILPYLPEGHFDLPEEATDPESAQRLWEDVREGRHPLTREGIVIHPPTGKPLKSKLLEEQDVTVTGTFPGRGKYEGTGAGGFTYALEPGGETIGRVGTGLADQLRRELYTSPEAYIGRTARVRSQGAFPSGALRAPALLALHEDLPAAYEKQSETPFWQRAMTAQLFAPSYSPGAGLLSNIFSNVGQAVERGRRMVRAQDMTKNYYSAQSPLAALARMRNYLSQGDFVKSPIDRLLFRPLPRF